MTAAEFIKNISRELGEDHNNVQIQNTFLRWLRDGLAELANEDTEWLWSRGSQDVTTTSGVGSYELLPEVAEIRQVVRKDTGSRLRVVERRQLSMHGHKSTESGAPVGYYISSYSGNRFTLNLWPVPSGTYDIRVDTVLDPAAIELTSTIDLPSSVVACLTHYVRAEYHISASEDLGMYDRLRTRYSVCVRNSQQKFSSQRDKVRQLGYRDVPNSSGWRDPKLTGDYPSA